MPSSFTSISRRTLIAGTSLLAATALLTGCAGEGSGGAKTAESTLNIDFATYNPLSLVLKEKGWLDSALKEKNVTVNWVQSAGSNKANEALRAGAIDVGSTAGAAALLARANGAPIKTIGVFSKPEWAAIVVRPDSTVKTAADLKGKKIAATKGTDPYFFLLQTLDSAGLKPGDVTVENLQHADGRTALEGGSVDAWSGLDPIMGAAEAAGNKLVIRNVDYNTYGLLNATESFIKESPETAQIVVDAYEKARAWAATHQEETAQILAKAASIDPAVATTVITTRSNLDVSGVPGEAQTAVLGKVGGFLVESGDVDSQAIVDKALTELIDAQFASKADASRVKGE